MPLISVLMSVYNTKEEYLRESIQSILSQTFSDFEFIIVDDGSNRETKAVLDSFIDDRIVRITNSTNVGLTQSLVYGVEKAKGKYIARMDADDVSAIERLQIQIKYMEDNANVAVVGTSAYILGTSEVIRMPKCFDREHCQVKLLFENIGVIHPSAMIRKQVLDENGLNYNPKIKKAQDYDLWVNIAKVAEIRNIDIPLLFYRVHPGQISVKNADEQQKYTEIVKRNQYHEYGLDLDDGDIDIMLKLTDTNEFSDSEVRRVIQKISKWNDGQKTLNKSYLRKELYRIWYIRVRTRLRTRNIKSVFCTLTMKLFLPWNLYYIMKSRR